MSLTAESATLPREIEMPTVVLRHEADRLEADRRDTDRLDTDRDAPSSPRAGEAATPASDAGRAIAFVAAHFHEKFPASAVATHCGLSRFQFSRAFHASFGITFREYLLRYRIRAACERLRGRPDSVTAVAYAVGFHDGSYFARMFRRYIGMLPSQYARWHDSRPTPPPAG
jgi:AraC-like DNA-binding protein